MYPISKNRMDGTQDASLRLLKSICGDSMAGVTIVSSMWSNIEDDTGAMREQELMDKYWRVYMDHGCLTKRFYNTRESAISIINDIVAHSPGISLDLQKKPRSESILRKLFRFVRRLVGGKPLCSF